MTIHDQGNCSWFLRLPARKSFTGNWNQTPKKGHPYWHQITFAPWNGARRQLWRDRFEWRTQFFGDDRKGPGRWTTVHKQGDVLLDLHEEREWKWIEELEEDYGVQAGEYLDDFL